MSAITPNPPTPTTDEEYEALTNWGLAIYEKKLKPILEPDFDKKYVAIHVDTEDCAVASSSGDAMRAIRKRRPDGFLLMMRVGNEPEWGLAGRILAGELAAGRINFDLLSSTISRSNSYRGTKQ
jgi:hypothetical protein